MEARASFTGTSVPKTFVAFVLIVIAMGLAAMGGYVARGLSGGAAEAQGQPVHAAPGTVLRQDYAQGQAVHAAAGTVLRQDNPARASAELPSYIPQAKAARGTRILQDDPYFIAQYGGTSQAVSSDGLSTRMGGHRELP
jgi:hypothetical protein